MTGERTECVEIGRNGEIGGYQYEFGEGEPAGPRGPILDTVSEETQASTPRAP